MFFQPTEGQEAATEAGGKLAAAATATSLLKKELDKLTDPLENISESFLSLMQGAEGLNKLFIGNRSRIQETMTVMSQLIPMVTQLGGTYDDAEKALLEVSSATRRNVVASEKDISSLFATGKLVGKSVADIVESFGKVGVQYKNISKGIGDSIVYVRTVGANAQMVMKDVAANVAQLSRYNFEGGVVGLTKMAAQASLLRYDMGETFKLAEEVLDPERAVEVASAFQRLGVSAGNLVDPFQLMNQSINDPSGLQDSLIGIGKQFTYFDEKTKSFKINPQGILTLREMEKQTGMSAQKLKEAALSAADFDQRLSAVGKSKFSIGASEEDKKLLANIARMGQDTGVYEVQVKDEESGKIITKALQDLNKEEFDTLIKEQKKGPQTVEAIQKNQLDISELSLAQLRSINANIGLGVVGGSKFINEATRISNVTFRDFAEDTREDIEIAMKNIKKLSAETFAKLGEKGADKSAIMEDFAKRFKSEAGTLGGSLLGNVGEIAEGSPMMKSITKFLTDAIPNKFKEAIEKLGGIPKGKDSGFLKVPGTERAPDIFRRTAEMETARATKTSEETEPSKGVLDVSGKITIEVMGKDLELSGPVTKALQNATTTIEEKIFSMVENQARIKGIKLGGKS